MNVRKPERGCMEENHDVEMCEWTTWDVLEPVPISGEVGEPSHQ